MKFYSRKEQFSRVMKTLQTEISKYNSMKQENESKTPVLPASKVKLSFILSKSKLFETTGLPQVTQQNQASPYTALSANKLPEPVSASGCFSTVVEDLTVQQM